MKTSRFTDILSKSIINEYHDIIANADAPHYSEEYKRKMDELDNNFYSELNSDADRAHPIRSMTFYPVMRSAAAVFLAICLSISAVCAVSPTARAAVFGFVKSIHDTFISYTSPGEESDADNTAINDIAYKIAHSVKIPEGYTLSDQYSDDSYAVFTYSDSAGHMLSISVAAPDSGITFNGDISNGALTETIVNGSPAELFTADPAHQADTGNSLTWLDKNNGCLYSITAFLSADELISLAEAICS